MHSKLCDAFALFYNIFGEIIVFWTVVHFYTLVLSFRKTYFHIFLLFTRFTKNTLTKNTTFSCAQLHSSFQAKRGSNLVLETQRVHCFTKKTGHFLKYFFVQWSAGLHIFIFCILQKTWLQFSAETFRLIKYKAWRKYYKVRSNPC